MQGIELPPLVRTLPQLKKQGYSLRPTSLHDKRIRLLALTAQGRTRLDELNRVIETYQHYVTYVVLEAELASFNATFNQITCDLRTIHEGDNRI